MDKLPQELINRIVWSAKRYPDQAWLLAIGQHSGRSQSEFPRLANLNRAWKEAIETVIIQSLKMKSDELETFNSIVTGHRRKYLSKISFTALLPEYFLEDKIYSSAR